MLFRKCINPCKVLMLALFSMLLVSCTEDENGLNASVLINETGDTFGGDVVGNGGSVEEVYKWKNNFRRVDWNMDITSTSGSSFGLRIDDADGNNVLDQTLIVGQGDDSKSGLSKSGTAGEWTVIVTLTNINGDGSFSISPED